MEIRSELVPDGCDGKADKGKTRKALLSVQFRAALLGVARILTFGAIKYPSPPTDDSWRDVPNAIIRYSDAFDRHIDYVFQDVYAKTFSRSKSKFTPGVDAESGELHIDHAICNLLFLRDKLYGANFDAKEIKHEIGIRLSDIPDPADMRPGGIQVG